jgi:site-specific DNA recombinase
LLVGRVFDAHGRRLTPSHAIKRGKRYRYYVTPSAHKTEESYPAVRIPAQDLENLVADRIHTFFAAEQPLLDTFAINGLNAERQKILLETAKKHLHTWAESSPATRYAFIQSVITRVLVKDKSVEIQLSRLGLKQALLENGASINLTPGAVEGAQVKNDAIILTIDAQVIRRGLEVRLVLTGDTPQSEVARISQSLIKAIARGRHWYEQLTSGKRVTLGDLAAESGVNDRYASRILRCAFLAPDIVESILEGKQPSDMTLDKMLDTLSLNWEDQRRVWNF